MEISYLHTRKLYVLRINIREHNLERIIEPAEREMDRECNNDESFVGEREVIGYLCINP